jgi:hypothetical protein
MLQCRVLLRMLRSGFSAFIFSIKIGVWGRKVMTFCMHTFKTTALKSAAARVILHFIRSIALRPLPIFRTNASTDKCPQVESSSMP